MDVYLDGSCYEFAVALKRGTGWPMIGIMEKGVIRHAGVRNDAGEFIDSRGIVPHDQIGKPFGLAAPYIMKEVSEQDLLAVRQMSDLGIHRASLMAETLWPSWPWKETCFKSRAAAFLADLDRLCRKHDVWIRAPLPNSDIILDERVGDEGFIASQTLTGQYFFDRRLES